MRLAMYAGVRRLTLTWFRLPMRPQALFGIEPSS